MRHGATFGVKLCSHEGCAKHAKRGGVCERHDALAIKLGVRREHGANTSLATSMGKAETSFEMIRGCKTTSERTIDAQVGKIDTRDRQAKAGHDTASCESPSLPPPAMTPSFSDDDDIGAWVYKSRATAHKCAHFCELLSKDCGLSRHCWPRTSWTRTTTVCTTVLINFYSSPIPLHSALST